MTLAQLALQGLTAARGGAEWAKALAMGDMAPDATVAARRAVCASCPSRVRKALGGLASDWCGEPLTPGTDPPTCGCLLYGATAVGSKTCPQGKWP